MDLSWCERSMKFAIAVVVKFDHLGVDDARGWVKLTKLRLKLLFFEAPSG